jgi:hypothetical protein
MAMIQNRVSRIPELKNTMHLMGPGHFGVADRGMIALLNEERLRRVLATMLDEEEFLSPYGIRALSKVHERHPYVFHVQGQEYRVEYVPGESNTGMFGGNSNWRGPIWMPVNAMIIRALLNYYLYYGDAFRIECPTGSGRLMNHSRWPGDLGSANANLPAGCAGSASWSMAERPNFRKIRTGGT